MARLKPIVAETLGHVFTWLAIVGAACVGGATQAQQFSFQHYGEDDGLANLAVRCLIQDTEGFLWTCTENGLFRFDGRNFERFAAEHGLLDINIRSIAQDRAGHLWVGTPGNLYERVGDRFEPVQPDGRVLSLTNIGQQIISRGADTLLLVERGQLLQLRRARDGRWTVAPYFDPQQLAAEPLLRSVHAVFDDSIGGLWLGCGDRLCEVPGGETGRSQVRAWGPAEGVRGTKWRTLLRDRAGRLWARGVAGVVVREPGAGHFVPRDSPDALLTSSDSNAPMIEDAQGRVLTRNDTGLAQWGGDRWRAYEAHNGLAPTTISTLLSDQDGALWIGHLGRGLSRWLGYGNWEAWTEAQGIRQETVWNAGRRQDSNLMINTSAGCRRLEPQATRTLPCDIAGLPPGQLYGMQHAADGAMVVGLRRTELYRVDPSGRSATKMATLPAFLHILLDIDGDSLWVATNRGAYLVRRPPGAATDTWIASKPSGLNGSIADMARGPDGRLWFVTDEEGLLLRSTEGHWTTVKFDDPKISRSLETVAVGPDGTVWVGTSGGLARLVFDGEQPVRLDWIDEPLLRGPALTFMRFDRRGWLWVGTDVGLIVFDGKVWRRIDRTEGLVWNDTNSGAFFEDADGSLWIGTTGGLAHLLHPEQIQRGTVLTARVVAARYGDQPLSAMPGCGKLRVPWRSDASLDVRVAAMRPAMARGALFRYRIVGLSNEWFETTNPDIHVSTLEPNHYRIELIARRPNTGLMSEPSVLSFEISAPWWRTMWFYALVTTLMSSTAVWVWRRRTRALQARENQLERLLERATRDPLTGLWNRATILDMLTTEIERASATGASLAVAMIDIDHFKRINDSLGHLAGDEVLRVLGRHLAANVRQGDALGRYGGEELLLVMPGLAAVRPSHTVERLRLSIAQADIRFEGERIRITASIGVDWLVLAAPDTESLIGRADAALYTAKSSGRNRVVYAGANMALTDESTT